MPVRTGRVAKDGRAGTMRKRARATSNGKDWWRKLSLPRRGKKDTRLEPAPLSEAQSAKLTKRRQKLEQAVSAPRTARVKQLSVADWHAPSGRAILQQAHGNCLQSMGDFIDGRQHLYPEEVLYLVDRGSLDLRHHGQPVSLQHAWALCFASPNSLPVESYLTFAHLRRAGYVVRRACADLRRDGALPVSLSAWRVAGYKRRQDARPLFHVAVYTYEMDPPSIAEVAELLKTTGKTRVKIALIDRGVVVLTDVASNATPLSARFKKRYEATRSTVPAPAQQPGVLEASARAPEVSALATA